jgi:hypothetical protein
MNEVATKPAISFHDYQKMCKTFLRARLENYVERRGLTWYDLFEMIDSPAHNREKFNREIDEIVIPEYHMSNYPQMKNYTIL